MPVTTRVMNWNIEQLSWNKLMKPGMLNAIARTVNAANIDVLVLLEVKLTHVVNAMTALSAALGSGPGGGTGAATRNWQCFFLSFQTGKERYCVFIRDLDVVRPAHPVTGTGPAGTENDRLNNLQRNVFQLWPHADWTTSAYDAPMPRVGFRLPLLDVYASTPAPRAAKAQRSGFGGQPLTNGGYSLGRGYRTPALALLMVHSAASNYLVPIIMCHYASGSANALALAQIAQLKFLHLAQLFNSNPSGMPMPGQSGHVDVLDAAGAHTAVRIQELVLTGDLNIDFLDNVAGPGNTPVQSLVHNAYAALTATVSGGGSGAPAAAPGAAGPVPAVPFVLPVPPPPGPVTSTIPAQLLQTAVTSQGTIMAKPAPPAQPAGGIPPAPYVTAALDNFFYGGTNLAGAVVGFGPAMNNSGDVVNVPANIVNAPVMPPPEIDLRATALSYALTLTKNAQNAPNLQGGGAPPPALTALDRLIGARLVSDHLPVVLQFTCP